MPIQTTPKDSLTVLMREARRFPVLTAETEQELARRYRDHGDVAAMRQLVGSHLRLVVKIAMGYRGYGLPVSDLVSQGNVGLMLAIKKFDPDRGFRLSTYAIWWIRAEIQEYILHSWSIVKMGTTAAEKKLFFNLRKLKSRMKEIEEGDLSPKAVAAIAAELAVPEHEVVKMNRRLATPHHSLNAPLTKDTNSEWQDLLADESESHEALLGDREELDQRRQLLHAAMENLNDRERHIVTERRLSEDRTTLEILSRQYGISRERVRQIEARALEKLGQAMTSAAEALGLGRPAVV